MQGKKKKKVSFLTIFSLKAYSILKKRNKASPRLTVNGNLIFPKVFFILIKNKTNKQKKNLTRILRKLVWPAVVFCLIWNTVHVDLLICSDSYNSSKKKKIKEEMHALQIYFNVHVNCFQTRVKFHCFFCKDLWKKYSSSYPTVS